MSTIFGGDTGISYADLKRRKAMVEALAKRSRQAPRNVGEGLTAIGNALAAKVGEYRNEKKQAKLDARNSELIATLLGGKPGTPFVPNNPAVAPPNAPNTPGTPDPNVTPAAVDATPNPAMNPPSPVDVTGQEAYPGGPPAPAAPVVAGPAKIEGTFGKILAKHEGAGRFDTLFAHSQKAGGRFAGVDVTKMTIDQALQFAKPSGEYGQWVKAKLGSMGHRARVATPMGAIQIVGTTLRNTAKEMGLPGDTLMTPEVQVAMANHLARKRISKPGLSQAGKRRELRSEWEGFKNASNAELDAVIAEVETGKPVTAANFATGEGVGYTANAGAPARGGMPTAGDPNDPAVGAGPIAEAGNPVSPVGGEPTGPVATGPARIAQLLAVMADPSLSPQNRQMVQMLLGEEVRANRGMSAAERERFDYTKTTNDRSHALAVETAERNAAAAEERARLANERFEFDRTNAEAQRAAQAAMAEAKAARDAAEIARKQGNADRKYGQDERRYFNEDGTPRKVGGTTVNVGPNGVKYPDPKKGYDYVRNPDGTPKIFENGMPKQQIIPGSEADVKAASSAEKEVMRKSAEKGSSSVISQDIGRAIKMIEEEPGQRTGALGQLFSGIGGSGAHDLEQVLLTIKGNIGLDKLMKMKESSPTGGALGAISKSEMDILTSTMGALSQSQSADQLLFNLRRLEKVYGDIMRKLAVYPAFKDDPSLAEWRKAPERAETGSAEIPPIPDKFKDDPEFADDWKYMTPDERAAILKLHTSPKKGGNLPELLTPLE